MFASGRLVAVLSVLAVCVIAGSGGARGQSCAVSSGPVEEPCAPVESFAGAPAANPPSAGATSAAMPMGGGKERSNVAPAGTSHQDPFSRIGIGANVSPLGIGINGTTVLSDYFDARLMGNYFSYTSRQFEVEGVQASANLHLASMAASLDWYPFNSVWRLSPGVMLYNGNQFTANALVAGGTSVTIDGKTFYSASSNTATGATQLSGSGTLGLHPRPIAFTAAGGFGKFVPRSERHWSFPAEFGVVFMGAPTANVTTSGWVCTDKAQKNCSDISNSTNPVAMEFNSALQAQLAKWRRDVGLVVVYPMFSYSVVYSFNIR
ncbi:MAG: hypothetical protein ACLQHF_14660 [Terracidiphilus sp.]